jgi:hypothetical protein
VVANQLYGDSETVQLIAQTKSQNKSVYIKLNPKNKPIYIILNSQNKSIYIKLNSKNKPIYIILNSQNNYIYIYIYITSNGIYQPENLTNRRDMAMQRHTLPGDNYTILSLQ